MRTPLSLPRVAPGALLVCLLCAATDAVQAQDPDKTNQPVPRTELGDESSPAPGPALISTAPR